MLRKEVITAGKHSLIYVVGQALSRMVGFFMIPIYTTYLSPAAYGALDLIEILASIVTLVISINVADSMTRFYYAEKNETGRREVVSSAIIGLGVLGLPVALLFLALAGPISRLITEESQFRFCLQVAIAATWFSMLVEIGLAYLRMRYKAKLFVAITTIQLVGAVSLSIYFVVFRHLDVLGVIYSTLITQVCVGLFLSISILAKIRTRPSLARIKQLIGFGLPLVPSHVAQQLGTYSNRFLLRWLGPADPVVALAYVGMFALGHKFGVIVNRLVNVPLNAFWRPRRMELALSDDRDSKRVIARMCTYSLLLTSFSGLVIASLTECVLRVIADERYHGAHVITPLIVLGYVIHGLEPHFTTGIHVRRKTVWETAVGMIGLTVMLTCCVLCIPKYGAVGAATATLAGLTTRTTLFYVVSQRLYPIPFEINRIAKILVIAIGLFVMSQFINFDSIFLTSLARLLCVALFVPALVATSFFHEGEKEYAKELAKRGLSLIGSYTCLLRRTT